MKVVIVLILTLLSVAAAQNDDCGDGFSLVGSACYKIPDELLGWYDAMDHCRNLVHSNGMKAALARVETCSQLHSLWEFIKGGYPIVDYWLGGTTTMDPSGAFRWDSTGELVPMGVPFWFPGQPDFPSTQETGLSLSKTGYFADEEAHIKQKFICQLL
ncbi:hypothetical protein O3P69_010264 [Scylla paramamosain]|uniref:C-type lectin domain-containing protein n=1 Tax=Scylla paramamosain TaxID=85552 RepID=A0AAW0TSV2_SCYPA